MSTALICDKRHPSFLVITDCTYRDVDTWNFRIDLPRREAIRLGLDFQSDGIFVDLLDMGNSHSFTIELVANLTPYNLSVLIRHLYLLEEQFPTYRNCIRQVFASVDSELVKELLCWNTVERYVWYFPTSPSNTTQHKRNGRTN
jgi:hypothetical protein